MVDSNRMYHRQELLRLNKITYVNIYKLPMCLAYSKDSKQVAIIIIMSVE